MSLAGAHAIGPSQSGVREQEKKSAKNGFLYIPMTALACNSQKIIKKRIAKGFSYGRILEHKFLEKGVPEIKGKIFLFLVPQINSRKAHKHSKCIW
jgi:hypothetical protein